MQITYASRNPASDRGNAAVTLADIVMLVRFAVGQTDHRRTEILARHHPRPHLWVSQ